MRHLLRFFIATVAILAPYFGVVESNAQVVNSEGFESGSNPPSGWTILGSSSYFVNEASDYYPSASAHGGSHMVSFQSYNYSGITGSYVSPAFTLAGVGGNTPTVSFWFYRDAQSYLTGSYSYDSLAVYINTSISYTGATFLGRVARVYNYGIPNTVPSGGWYQYTFNVPASYTAAAPNTNYLIFKFYSSYGDNELLDDVSWTSYPLTAMEPFEAGLNPPTGWSILGSSSYFVNEGTDYYPYASAHAGTHMVSFQSYNYSGITGSYVTPSFSYAGVGSYTPTVSFWFYRDDQSYLTGSYSYDSLAVYINSSISYTGATFLGRVARVYNYAIPNTVSSGGWYQYTFNIPASYTASAPSTNYLIFKFYSSYGDNELLDDVSWTYYPAPGCSGQPSSPTITSSVISSPQNCGYSATITGTNPNTGLGHFVKWQQAPTSTGPWTSISGATSLSYTTPALSTTTYYRLIDSCGNSNLIGGSAAFTVPINTGTSVSISSNPGTSICTGSSASFTAVPTNGGSSPSYQWKLNGTNVTTGASYSPSSLSNGDVVACTITSNASCVITNTGTSSVTMNVFTVTPSVTIAASPSSTFCAGATVTFTATPTNGGTPTYQWKKNGVTVGGTTNVYTDNGLFNNDLIYCTITSNAYCAVPTTGTSNFISVTNTTPVTINTQPSNSTVCNGTGATFSVGASAGGTITYQWQLNTGSGFNNITNGGVYSGATSSSLSVSSSTLSMNGSQYRCILTSGCGQSATSAAVLDVNMPPNIVYQPNAATACTNTSANFSVTANGNTLTYQWMENSGSGFAAISNGGMYSGATSNSLTITNPAATMNGYLYECVVSGACTPSATTSAVSMTVNSLPGTTAAIPANTTICAGTNTSFNVTGSGTGATYQWQVNSGSGFGNVSGSVYSGANTSTLAINGATGSMNGYQYRCVVSGTCTPSVNSSSSTLNVNTSPAISSQPFNVQICPNGNASFVVAGVTGAAVTYQWQENSGSGFNNITNGGIYGGATSATLTLTGATSSMNTYQYRCVLSGTCTPTLNSNTTTLTFYTVPSIGIQPQSNSVCQGTNDSFSVTALGSGLTYQWMVNTGSGFVTVSNGAVYSGATSAMLHISNTTQGMNGYVYECVVSGTCTPNVTTGTATLGVNLVPTITSQPGNDTVCENSNSSIGIGAGGTGLTYQWSVSTGGGFSYVINGGVYGGATTSSLVLTNIPRTMNGYHFRCYIMGQCGGIDTSSPMILIVDSLPTIITAPVNTSVCVNNNTSLSVVAQGTGLSYQWKVNAGSGFTPVSNGGAYSGANTSTLNITAVPVSMAGYQYQCVISGTCSPAANTLPVSLQVNTPPAITLQPAPDTTCEGNTAPTNFKVVATGSILSYQWQVNTGSGFNNISNGGVYSGANSNLLGITGALTSMNGYVYRCIIAGVCTPTVTSTATPLTVHFKPSIVTGPTNDTICSGTNTSLSVTASGTGITYQWQVDTSSNIFFNISNNSTYGGTNSATLTITGATTSGYKYQCVVSGACTPSVATIPVTLTFWPTIPTTVVPSGATVFCAGNSVTLNVQTVTGNTYQWKLNNNNIINATNAGYTANSTGNYTVMVTNTHGCTALSANTTVTANPIPAAPINTLLGNLVFCKGDSVVFGTNATPGLLYEWMNNGIAIPGANGPTYTADTSGTYSVVVSQNNCNGTSSALTVVTNAVPVDTVKIIGNATVICSSGNTVTVSSVTAPSNPPQVYQSYQWYQNGVAISGANTTQYTTATGGWFNVSISNNLGCTILTHGKYILASNPNPVIVPSGLTISAPGFATYQWQLNGTNIPGATHPVLVLSQNGSYTVTVTDSNGCMATSAPYMESGLGVANVMVSGDDVKIYPNPASSVVNIDAPVKVDVSIISMQGKVALDQHNVKTMDISGLANGVYMMQVFDENHMLIKTEKLVKNNW